MVGGIVLIPNCDHDTASAVDPSDLVTYWVAAAVKDPKTDPAARYREQLGAVLARIGCHCLVIALGSVGSGECEHIVDQASPVVSDPLAPLR
jgi:hypothetical protein